MSINFEQYMALKLTRNFMCREMLDVFWNIVEYPPSRGNKTMEAVMTQIYPYSRDNAVKVGRELAQEITKLGITIYTYPKIYVGPDGMLAQCRAEIPSSLERSKGGQR